MYYLYVLLRVERSLIFYECFFVLNAIMKTMFPPSYHHNDFVATVHLGTGRKLCPSALVATKPLW